MSNSIWKTGYPKYEHDRSWDDIIQEYHREDGSKFYIVGDCSEPNDRWAYLTDIIAQADKAERLEKENEAMREEFEVWHGNYKCEVEEKKQLQKDLEIATKALKRIKEPTAWGSLYQEQELATDALETIGKYNESIRSNTDD